MRSFDVTFQFKIIYLFLGCICLAIFQSKRIWVTFLFYLGKWNKIHFLGLEGPAEESLIPNNIKQELTLWEIMYKKEI